MRAKDFSVGHEVPGRIDLHVNVIPAGMRRAASATSLVEEDDPVAVRVEQSAMPGRAASAWAAMEEHGGLAVGIATHLPIQRVAVADIEHALVVRLDLGKWLSHQFLIFGLAT